MNWLNWHFKLILCSNQHSPAASALPSALQILFLPSKLNKIEFHCWVHCLQWVLSSKQQSIKQPGCLAVKQSLYVVTWWITCVCVCCMLNRTGCTFAAFTLDFWRFHNTMLYVFFFFFLSELIVLYQHLLNPAGVHILIQMGSNILAQYSGKNLQVQK